MNNSLIGLDLAAGQAVQLSGLNRPIPPIASDNGQGGQFRWSGQTLLATTYGGPNWRINPTTGRIQRVIVFPKTE